MRYIIYGAGAIGGVIGARLHQAGQQVILICRGAQLEAIQRDGLLLRTPTEEIHQRLDAVPHPREIAFREGDVVLLTMKTQDTGGALRDLETVAGPDVPVVCCQNGVENERLAARRFSRVYAMLVALPATYLEPGCVDNECAPISGVLDGAVFPRGADDLIERVTADLSGAMFDARPEPSVMRLKYTKLLTNVGNALQLATGQYQAGGDFERVLAALRAEALACFAAAGIDHATEEEYADRVLARYRQTAIPGRQRGGSSTWQSLQRGRPEIETDYLNGEIVLLGRLHGVPTPLNALVRRIAARVAAGLEPAGGYTAATVEALAHA